ncbi:OsmC family peroxiredoxin [Elizabethkingia argentiflava]|uniref:OsmC family peroxiredoxin n=1 Tax=Elizabethkingia argenteiflava TaxID=2681556 RepID=A0A845PSQ5_9FLAO|nr:OsmC family protein [Elizabethkingia argenteiflava]NAW50071.1 OsmC family peroxiredoxin [Elizabethkingia argenteiflava]
MNITLNRIDDNYLFELTNENGHKILLDNTSQDNPQAVSPMEAVLMGLAGCSSIDMVAILKKQKQQITSFSASVEGSRVQVDEAKPFRNIHIVFQLEGEVDPKKANRAAELSFEKYCSVSKSLDPQVNITWEVRMSGV